MTDSVHERNETLVRRFFRASSDHDLEKLASLLADDFSLAYGNRTYDAEAFLENERAYIAAFPDLTYTIERLVTASEFATAQCTVTGTHDGTGGTGILAEHAPSGNTFETSSLNLLQIENGRITEVWTEWDALGMYDQLGPVEVIAD